MPAGRPLKFETVEELQKQIEGYFKMCDETVVKRILNKNQEIIAEVSKPYTITGLAEWLKTNRQTLVNYEEREEYFDAIKDAKAKIEACYEERALIGDNSPVVSIFTLKNNFNWKDKTETDITSAGKALSSITSEDSAIAQELNKLKQNGNNSATSEPSEGSIAGTMGGEVSNQE